MADVRDSFYRLAPYLTESEPDENGVIEYSDRRFVFFHTKMFAQLFQEMEEVAGPVIRSRIKRFGENAGHYIASKMDEDFRDVSVTDIVKLAFESGFDLESIRGISPTDELSQMEKIFGYGSHVGWLGDVDVVEYEAGERAEFKFYNSFESYSYQECADERTCETGGANCKFLTGVIKGIVGYYWENEDLTAEETQCAADSGHDSCRMVVKDET
ncbi:MAG: hypothetical protein ABEJ75_03085 [Candidatus Nanohaloarchaea archaeon]